MEEGSQSRSVNNRHQGHSTAPDGRNCPRYEDQPNAPALRSMRQISEDEAFQLAGDADCPVLRKEESDPMEAAVCLKRFPTGYVLGVSDKVRDLVIWFTEDLAVAEERCDECIKLMRIHGTPFGPEGASVPAQQGAAADDRPEAGDRG
jgi:hypothetical protein